jgi:hypothetical protein
MLKNGTVALVAGNQPLVLVWIYPRHFCGINTYTIMLYMYRPPV